MNLRNLLPTVPLLIVLLLTLACTSGQVTPPLPERPQATEPETISEPVTRPLELAEDTRKALDPEGLFLLGVEIEQDLSYPNLRSKRVALITDPTAIDQQGRHTVERMATTLLFSLVEVLVIEDGVTTTSMALERGLEVAAAVQAPPRVHRLHHEDWRLNKEMFRYIDIIVWDVSMRGSRAHLDTAVLGEALEFSALHGMQFLVLDRPNVMGRLAPDGPPSDNAAVGSRLAIYPVAPYPAMTSAELAKYFNRHFGIGADLRIRPMKNWTRGDRMNWLQEDNPHRLDELGFALRQDVRGGPIFAPGMVELLAVRELAGVKSWRYTNLRLGKGGIPELILAPRDIGAVTLMERLSGLDSMGVAFRPSVVEIDDEEVGAVTIEPTAGESVDFLLLAMSLHYCVVPNPRSPGPDHDFGIFASEFIEQGLSGGMTPSQVRRRWIATQPRFRSFQEQREGVLLYQP